MWRDAAIGTALAALLFVVGWDAMGPGAGGATAQAASARHDGDVHEFGRSVYNFRCYFCHGYSGDAKTLAATYLQPAPRDFTRGEGLNRAAIAAAVHDGRPGTAMASFKGTLSEREIDAVAAFVEREFVQQRAPNTRYHTAANGWPGHERHAAAFPFARGDIALDAPEEALDRAQRAGRQLFLSACVSCHDRARVVDEGPAWSSRPVSYPRFGFVPGQPNTPPVDAVSSASVYAKHELPPQVANLSPREKRGEALFQRNCAFCHGADGTGKNWIGQFMEPKARDLTAYAAAQMPPPRLRQVILDGLPGTSMPAWRHVLKPAEVDAIAAYVSRAMVGTRATGVAAAR
ncbi:MAG TPA: c-type cytochrome [Burkholderiaceae bacterium]|nr:c-type cytochrome [Burkholderiaceae bacterium]